jgi:hypothetical protein
VRRLDGAQLSFLNGIASGAEVLSEAAPAYVEGHDVDVWRRGDELLRHAHEDQPCHRNRSAGTTLPA